MEQQTLTNNLFGVNIPFMLLHGGLQPSKEVSKMDLTIYGHLIDRWSADKSKAQSTLTDMLMEDEDTKQYLLTNYTYNTLRNMTIGGDIVCECNNHDVLIVRREGTEEKVCGIISENHALTAAMVTQITALKIVKLFPDISTILKDIRAAKAERVPELPSIARSFIRLAVFSPIREGENYLLPVYSRERLSNVYSNMIYRNIPVDTEYHAKTLKDLSIQIRNEITRKKLIKESLPRNAEIPIMLLLIETLQKYAESDNKETLYDAWGF